MGGMIKRKLFRKLIQAIAMLAVAAVQPTAGHARQANGVRHPLTMDDVLGTEHLDGIALSPDGEWIAAVVQRSASVGEVYGRTAYETDPSRNDIWLISRKTGQRRNITNGAATAAGFWCASWSPDGQQLAMLSTQPQSGESRGGNNVRLYVWDRGKEALTRMGDVALMTQTRFGSPLYRLDLRGGADNGSIAHTCSLAGENAPFAWLDDHRLIAVTLPTGQTSALIDEYSRPYNVAALDNERLHQGITPTVHGVGSGAERLPRDERDNSAIIRTINVATGAVEQVTTVPTYPFTGALSLSISPDRRRIAVMATLSAFQPKAGRVFPHTDDDAWTAERQLGFIDFERPGKVRWARMPPAARYPLELYGWSPDSRNVALRARDSGFAEAAPLYVVSTDGLNAVGLGSTPVEGDAAGSDNSHESPVVWIDDRRLIAHLQGSKASDRADWWLLDLDGGTANITSSFKQPPTGFRLIGSRLTAIADNMLVAFHPGLSAVKTVARLREGAAIAWPLDPNQPADAMVIQTGVAGQRLLQATGPTGSTIGPELKLPASATLLASDTGNIVWQNNGPTGLFLRETVLRNGRTRMLLSLDTGLAAVDWGRKMLIDYHGIDGQALKGAVILPPGYVPGLTYPTLLWVYEGYRVDGLEGEYWLDPFLPGIYNLQLYAAQGYVVLIPSMPFARNVNRSEVYAQVTNGVLPAIDRLVALGIADRNRIGVMGQSYGGYSVYALVTQTNRFRAAVAIAGITDIAGLFGQFDPVARGYTGIDHEKSANWAIVSQYGLYVPPGQDAGSYSRNSPLTYVDRVTTPLLMIHGEYDMRGSVQQAEQFFYGLYSQGKTARLLRYGGETHSLAQSPANIRDIFSETVGWFDKYLKPTAEK
jgi:dipeptidyl aminopeptidase/acylaminoacyl peptidase